MRFVSKLAHFAVAAAVLLAVGWGLGSCSSPTNPKPLAPPEQHSDGNKPRVVYVEVRPVTDDPAYNIPIEGTPYTRNREAMFKFSVNVRTEYDAPTDVIWSIDGYFPGGGTLFTVAPDNTTLELAYIGRLEGKGPLLITATSVFDPGKSGYFSVSLPPLSSSRIYFDNALIAIQNLYDTTVVSDNFFDGKALDVFIDKYGVPGDALSAFDGAVSRATADGIAGKYDDAYEALLSAAVVFDQLRMPGVKPLKPPTEDLDNAIKAAITLLEATLRMPEGTTAEDVAEGTYFHTNLTVERSFTNAIAAAELVLINDDATAGQIDAALLALQNARAAFNAVRILGTRHTVESLSKEALLQALLAASEVRINVVIVPNSADASAVDFGRNWVTQSQSDTLRNAIVDAEHVRDAATTQEAIDNAVIALNAAIAVYKADLSYNGLGTGLDRSAYNTEIARAASLTNPINTVSAADGSAVSARQYWAPTLRITAVTTAVTTAQTVNAQSNLTQSTLNVAVIALRNANDALEGAREEGWLIEKTALGTRIADTETMIRFTEEADDEGATDADIPLGTRWAKPSAFTAIGQALASAKTVFNRTVPYPDGYRAYQLEVDGALTALTTAATTFEAARSWGTKEPDPDPDIAAIKLPLHDAYVSANTRIQQVRSVTPNPAYNDNVALHAAEITKGREWAFAEHWDNFNDVIEAAYVVYLDTTLTDEPTATEAVGNALTALAAARSTFEGHVELGTFLDILPLTRYIAEVETRVNSVLSYINLSGNPINAGQEWAAPSDITTINTAISVAKAVLVPTVPTSPPYQAQIDAARPPLQTAYDTFISTIHVKADDSGLKATISEARDEHARSALRVSTDGGEYYSNVWWVSAGNLLTLSNAISAAEAVTRDALKTKTELDAADDTLWAVLVWFNESPYTETTVKKEGTKSSAAEIVIVFDPQDLGEDTIDLDKDGSYVISKSQGTAIRIDVINGLEVKYWIVDGGTYHFAEDPTYVQFPAYYLAVGRHSITVVVEFNGVPYNKQIFFTVRN